MMARDLVDDGTPDQDSGKDFSTPFSLVSHLKASRSSPLTTPELVSTNSEEARMEKVTCLLNVHLSYFLSE